MKELLQTHIRILFQQPNPQLLLDALTEKDLSGTAFSLSSAGLSEDSYLHCAKAVLPERSDDELLQFFFDLKTYLDKEPTGGIFSLLGKYSEDVMRFRAGVPQCRTEKLLKWRELSIDLGQDLFTCSGLAWNDVKYHCQTNSFCWPSAIRIDHSELYTMLSQRLSENHYHLNASTQCFPLTWSFLMNHPAQISRYFEDCKFKEDLQQTVHWGPGDNVRPWAERVLFAAWLRARLFLCIHQPNFIDSAVQEFGYFRDAFDQLKRTEQQVENLRFQYGARFLQPDGLSKCLDYAISPATELNKPYANRLLSGERQLLYNCLKYCYTGQFPRGIQDMLYLYLLIKLRFRREIIQSNQRYGFRNFSEFQDRKGHIWGDFPEFWSESYRLSIAAVLESPIHSLEMRVMAGKNTQQLNENISLPDQHAYFHQMELTRGNYELGNPGAYRAYAQDQEEFFFVLHFAKQPLEHLQEDHTSEFVPCMRYQAFRESLESQALSIAEAMEKSGYLCSRIRGIDAASHEIGCRPEVFGTVFRFLRGFSPTLLVDTLQPRHWPLIGATYHVGEDFLDIVDGLRAIDEAVCFLELERGDRIGHALALGIGAQAHYSLKKMRSVLPAQDLLDNLVWLLFRGMEWGIPMPQLFRSQLEQRAEDLFRRLYGQNCPNASLNDYFYSWTLRGDDPSPYFRPQTWQPTAPSDLKPPSPRSQYPQYCKGSRRVTGIDPEVLRKQNNVLRLLYYYQFGRQERMAGQVPESFEITSDYIEVVTKFQEHMMRQLMLKDICIECNPSSNYLIGTFRQYHLHPIFRFNSFGLSIPEHTNDSIQLRVSINTDDQGIFDTSLENEYALLYSCLCERPDTSFSHDAVYGYLDHIRLLGNGMIFPKAIPQLQTHPCVN